MPFLLLETSGAYIDVKENESEKVANDFYSERMKELEKNSIYYTQLRYILGEFLKTTNPNDVLAMILQEISTLTGGKPSIAIEYEEKIWERFSLEYYRKEGTWLPKHLVSSSLYNYIRETGDFKVNIGKDKRESIPAIIMNYIDVLETNAIILLNLEGTHRIIIEVSDILLPERIEQYFEAVKEFIIPLRLSIQHALLLQESERARCRADLLLDLIFHDIRSSLGNLQIGLELMELKWSDPVKSFQLLQDAMFQADEANSLINRVKRVLTTRVAKDLENCDLSKILESSIGTIRTMFPDDALDIEVENNIINRTVMGDDLLQDVFINLLSNALKAMDNKSEKIIINIDYWEDTSEYVKISIIDRGRGMPDRVKPRVSGRFLTESIDGIGLGLSIVTRIIEDYGGSLWFESRVPDDWRQGTIANVVLRLS